ncbi:MAG: acyl carrier protein [Gemmataceae bacterium]|nr:acyl carrier protein [Gemmataceae bacterium]
MNRDSIRCALATIMENELGVQPAGLNDSANLRGDLGLDSVDFVSVISQVERQFKIHLSQGELGSLLTVGSLLDLLESKLPKKRSEAA